VANVFVSYARTDKARAAPLVATLQAHGCSVWCPWTGVDGSGTPGAADGRPAGL